MSLASIHRELDESLKTQLATIAAAAEQAIERIDWQVDEMKELADIRWFEGYLGSVLSPGSTGYLFFEMELAYKVAEQVGVTREIARIVIERISPKGARMMIVTPRASR